MRTSRERTYPQLFSYTLPVCEDTSQLHRRSTGRWDLDMLTAEGGTIRRYSRGLQRKLFNIIIAPFEGVSSMKLNIHTIRQKNYFPFFVYSQKKMN